MTGFSRSAITAPGGLAYQFPTRNGGGGTIFYKTSSQSYGEVVVDNAGVDTGTTPLPAIGAGTLTGISGSTLTLSNAVPYNVAGLSITLTHGANQFSYLVISGSGNAVTLAQAPDPSVQIGDPYQGVLRLDIITVIGKARVSTADQLSCPNITVDTAGGASLTAANYP
jgi:hypothetical protein